MLSDVFFGLKCDILMANQGVESLDKISSEQPPLRERWRVSHEQSSNDLPYQPPFLPPLISSHNTCDI